MGRIYRAVDKKLNEEVALKLIRPEIASEKRTLERFHNELKLARKISHPNVGRMYELLEEKGVHFITMEYVPGEDLKSSIRRFGQLPISKSISITKQICEGLAEAHKIGVIHRDLKPSNIMVDKEGNAKVMDFGIARSLKTKGITGEGVSVGTPEYMSPEQVEGKEADQRADIYSLGIILYEMVTGRVPFEGDTPFSIAIKHKSERPERPKKLNPQIPEELNRLILRCLEKDRESRYQGAGEMLSELTKIEKGIPATEKAVPKRRSITSKEITVKFSIRKLFIPALAIVAIGGVIVLSIFLIRRQLSKQPIIPSHKQLTFSGNAFNPVISPDRKFLAHIERSGPTEFTDYSREEKVLLQDLVSGQTIELFKGSSCGNLQWMPNGSELSLWAADPSLKEPDFLLISRLGGSWRPLNIKNFGFLAWSPDASQFAASGRGEKGIWIGKKSLDSIPLRSTSKFFSMAWSPRGNLILICTQEKDSGYAVWLLDIIEKKFYGCIEDKIKIISPQWALDGNAIFYLLDKGQTKELWKISISPDKGNPEGPASLVLGGLQAGDNFSITNDGRQLFYERTYKYSNLWLITAKAEKNSQKVETKSLTPGSLIYETPRISPDGTQIAFSRGDGKILNIFIMPIKGGIPKQITFLDSLNLFPTWSSDGKEIAFCSDEGGRFKVWIVGAQGGTPRQLFDLGDNVSNIQRFVGGYRSGTYMPNIWSNLRNYFLFEWSPGENILFMKLSLKKPGIDYVLINPSSGKETSLFKEDEKKFDISNPIYSPDGKKIVARCSLRNSKKYGLMFLSLEDLSQRFLELNPESQITPLGWTADGKWIYGHGWQNERVIYKQINAESGEIKPMQTLPFNIAGRSMIKILDGKPEVMVDSKILSDIWMVENLDLSSKK
jgi:serine/threonine protein kinase